MVTRYRGIVVVLGAILVVWVAGLLQLFRAPDGWIYDLAVRTGGWKGSGIPSVMMVETDPGRRLTGDEGLAIAEYLQQLGAGQVVFLSAPQGAGDRFRRLAEKNPSLILGNIVKIHPYSGNGEGVRRQSSIPPVVSTALPGGALSIPTAEFGVHRRAATAVQLGGRAFPTLAMVAALQQGKQPQPGEFRVNFNRGADWLPRVSVDRVLGKRLIAELVAGRSVVIGEAWSAATPGIYTPLNANGPGMSLLEFQAYAIDTLLQGKQIRPTPWTLNLLLLGSIGLLSLAVYQWLNLDRSGWFTISLVGVYLLTGWLLLHGLLVWIPVVEMATAQILMFWFFVRLKLLRDDQRMRHTVLERMSRLKDYMLPPDFYSLDEHWAQVITFVDQTLNLNRVIFLEKVEDDHRVREVQALRCSLDDIDERRRDFERVPYSDAIAEGGPIKLESRLFFSNTDDSIFEQYLVPLLFAGEVQGFWAFDVDPFEIESSENFLGNIRNFGSQIAELLYHRHRWIEQRDSDTRIFRRFFRLEAGKASSEDVGDLLGLLDNRLNSLQAVFDGLTTATIEYDLFGRVVQLNRSMEKLMDLQDLPGYKLTALNLLEEITGMTQQQARRLLQQVVVDRRDFHIPLKLKGDKGERYSVHVKPLAVSEAERTLTEATTPFELAGILFEVSDESSLMKRLEVKEQLLDWMRLRIRSDLMILLRDADLQEQLPLVSGSDLQESLQTAGSAAMLGPAGRRQLPPSPGSQEPAVDLYSQAADLLTTLETVQSVLSSDSENPASSVFPVDIFPLIDAAIGELHVLANEKKIRLDVEIPRLMGLVKVQPEKIGFLFRTLLEVLISDAAADTELRIRVSEKQDTVRFSFSNHGFGIPDEHLQAYLWATDYAVTEEFKDLRQAVRPIARWGGSIEIHSEVGTGMWAELQLAVVR